MSQLIPYIETSSVEFTLSIFLPVASLALLRCEEMGVSEICESWKNTMFYWKRTAKLAIFIKSIIGFVTPTHALALRRSMSLVY